MNADLNRLYDFVEHHADRVLLSQTPMLMMPRFGQLPPLGIGQRRYVAAADGIYIQAKSLALEVCLLFAPTPAMPFGSLAEKVELERGIPEYLYRQFAEHARNNAPNEVAALVHWNPTQQRYIYSVTAPISSSPAHVSYATGDFSDERLVLDFHSHGDGAAFFSATDDQSDLQGLHISCVLGVCRADDGPEHRTRICVDGFFYPVPWAPWEAQ